MKRDVLHILLIEDDPAHVEAIRRAFENTTPHAVIDAVNTLQQFRTAAAGHAPDIAIMDLNLPDGRATEALTTPPVANPFPFVLMTSFGNEQIAVEAMKAGALDYIVKSPEAFAAMPRTAERVLREWDLLQAHRQAVEAREKLEAQLHQSQKMEAVGRLAGGVAHDFNNMLQTILGNADLALEDMPADSPLRDILNEIKIAARRSADLTMQLLAFARKQIIVPQTLDLNQAVADMLKMLRRLIGEDIELQWKPATALGPVKMDPGQLNQVLTNLTVNARDAISGVGTLTINTGSAEFDDAYCQTHAEALPGAYVLLTVSDTGCGMDRETMGRLFEPFFTTKEVGKGTGLGLAMVYGIVKQNRGFIQVASEPGKGSTFTICLPQHVPEPGTLELPPSVRDAPTGTHTVLLVEDEPALLRSCRRTIEKLGYTVLAAGNPKEALQLTQAHPGDVHLLLTDVVMPGMSGRKLQEQIAATQPQIKVLYMSGYTADIIAPHGVLDGDVHFLQKPFTREALATKLRDVLAG